MSALLWSIGSAAWLAIGFGAARRMAGSWFDEFGDYEGMPTTLCVLATLMGPVGWIMALLIAPPAFAAGLGAKVFGAKR